jgi:translation initiation factor IF-1
MPRHSGDSSKRKSDGVVSDYIYDLKHKIKGDEPDEEVYVARVIKTLGNARIEVVYSHGEKVFVAQAKIPGRFTGRAKKTMMVSPGTFILVSKTGVTGALALEMVAIVSREEVAKIQDLTFVHANVVSLVTDAGELQTRTTVKEDGFVFEGQDEVDIDNV